MTKNHIKSFGQNSFLFLNLIFFSAAALAQMQTQVIPAPASQSSATSDTQAKISGTPRLIRDYPVPQVFFTAPLWDGVESLYLPANEDYNRMISALSTCLRNKMPISMVVNKRTKMILDVDAPKSQAAKGSSDDTSVEPTNSPSPAVNIGNTPAAGLNGMNPQIPGAAAGQTPPPPPAKSSGWAD